MSWPKTPSCCKCAPSSASTRRTWDRTSGAWCSISRKPAAGERQPGRAILGTRSAPKGRSAAWPIHVRNRRERDRDQLLLAAGAARHLRLDHGKGSAWLHDLRPAGQTVAFRGGDEIELVLGGEHAAIRARANGRGGRGGGVVDEVRDRAAMK